METRVEVLGRNLKEAGFLLEEELSHDYGKKRNRGTQDDSWSHGLGIKCLIDAAVENLQQYFLQIKMFPTRNNVSHGAGKLTR